MKRILKDKKAVIFDMDGVLVDSEKYWSLAEYEVFSSLGVPLSDSLQLQTQTMSTKDATRFWYRVAPWKHVTMEEAEQMVIHRVIRFIETESCCIPGITAFIENLRHRQYRIGLATNSPRQVITSVLEKTGTASLFDAVCSAESEQYGKPHPAVYLTAARKLQTPPRECLAIEDSLSGMRAAAQAGMTVIAFTDRGRNHPGNIAAYAISCFEHPVLTDCGGNL